MYVYVCIHTYRYEYYSVKRKKEILPLMTIWMDLEGIMLSEISQTQKDKYLSSHMWNVKQTAT